MEFRDNGGALISGGVTSPDTERSLDSASYADCTNEFTEIGTSGTGYIDLTAAEMNADMVQIKATCSNSNSRPFTQVLYPEELGDVRVNVGMFDGIDFATDGANHKLGWIDKGTAQAATSTTLQLRAAAAFANNELIGATISITGGSAGVGQRRIITAYNGSTDTATVDAWDTTPSGTVTYLVFATAPASSGVALAANVTQIGGDSTAPTNLKNAYNGTGYKDVDNLYVVRSATAQAGAAGTITLDASASAVTDFYANTYLQIIGGTGAGQARFISAYNGSTKVATVNGNWATNPDNTSVFVIWPFSLIPGASAPTTGQNATAVLTTQMTEAYAADGTAPTLTQAIMAILQILSEASISGSTMTVKKLDGSTTALVLTLNSSFPAALPTSVTRTA